MSSSRRDLERDLPALGEALDFLRLFWAVDHALNRRSKRLAIEIGVTGPQRIALRIVGRFPGIPAGRLAELLHLHPSTLTGVLARLEKSGLIARRADPRDRRRALLALSERGRRLDQEDSGTGEAELERALASVPRRDLEVVRRVLLDLARALDTDAPGVSARARAGDRPGSAPRNRHRAGRRALAR